MTEKELNSESFDEAYAEYYKDDFLSFARGLFIPTPAPRLLEEAMLDYENKGIEPFQRRFFRDIAPALHAVRDGTMPPCRRFWMERTKKGSKDNDAAICVLWLMAFAKRPIECSIVAASFDQAKIIKKRVDAILFHNEWLYSYVKTTVRGIDSLNGLGKTEVLPTDKATGHGGTPDFLILNELVHVTKWEAMETHFNNAAGVPRGLLLIATNAGYKGTKAEVWKNMALRQKKKWTVHVWDKMAPWLNTGDVDDAKEMNTKSEFERLFGKPKGGDNWASGKGDAISEESIDRVFRPDLEFITKRNGSVFDAELNKYKEGWDFLGGLDLGVSHDHAGLIVIGVHRELKKMRVAFLKDWAPSIPNREGKKIVDIDSIRKTVKFVHDRYKIVWFGYDPAAGGSFLAQDMKKEGVWMSEVLFQGASKNEMAICFVQVIESGVLQCFENEILRRDLGKFKLVTKPVSGYRLDALSDAYGHADVGTALILQLSKAIILMGGLPSGHSEFLMDMPTEPGEEEVEITDPDLLDILGDGREEEEYEYQRMMKKDPFADYFN